MPIIYHSLHPPKMQVVPLSFFCLLPPPGQYTERDTVISIEKEEVKQGVLEHFLFPDSKDEETPVFNAIKITYQTENFIPDQSVIEIEQMAVQQNLVLESKIALQSCSQSATQIFGQVGIKIKQYKMRQSIADIAREIRMPKFILSVLSSRIFDFGEDKSVMLNRINLLKNFKLLDCESAITFDSPSSKNLYKIDTEEIGTIERRLSKVSKKLQYINYAFKTTCKFLKSAQSLCQ